MGEGQQRTRFTTADWRLTVCLGISFSVFVCLASDSGILSALALQLPGFLVCATTPSLRRSYPHFSGNNGQRKDITWPTKTRSLRNIAVLEMLPSAASSSSVHIIWLTDVGTHTYPSLSRVLCIHACANPQVRESVCL